MPPNEKVEQGKFQSQQREIDIGGLIDCEPLSFSLNLSGLWAPSFSRDCLTGDLHRIIVVVVAVAVRLAACC